MVVSRSDSKRRKKEEDDTLQESPKRTKVHAQRKFAQGSHLNSPVMTPVKDKDKTKYNGAAAPAELLPVKRPKTEEFVNFLCFRGSDLLPKALEFFNEPSIPEPLDDDGRRDSFSAGTSKVTSRSSDKHSDQVGGVAKAEAKTKNKSKSTAAVQALKKKYQKQRLAKEKRTLTKLALKVKGKNMMRTRSAGPLDEQPSVKTVRSPRVVASVKRKIVGDRKPVLRKHNATTKKLSLRGGLRSSGELPPGSDIGLKPERKPRKIIKVKSSTSTKNIKKSVIASSLSDFSSDDDQPLVKKQRIMPKKSLLTRRVITRSGISFKASNSKVQRPTRKTKEAATLFMEMLGKDFRSPEEEGDDNDDAMSVESFIELPNSKRTEKREKEFKELAEKNKIENKKQLKSNKKEIQSNVALPKKKEERGKKINSKPVAALNILKSRALRRNSYRLLSKEVEVKRLNSNPETRILRRMSYRSSAKELLKDNTSESEKAITKKIEKNSKKENKNVQTVESKKQDLKVKQQKVVTAENLTSKLQNSKHSADNVFNDSDEEPLGNKVGQSFEALSKSCVKKVKTATEKANTSSSSGQFKLSALKLTNKKSLLAQDMPKKPVKSLQALTRSRQSQKNSVKLNVSEINKEKPEIDGSGADNPRQELVTKSKLSEINTEKPVITKVKPKTTSSVISISVDLEHKPETTNPQIKQQSKKKITKPISKDAVKDKEEISVSLPVKKKTASSSNKDELEQKCEEKRDMVSIQNTSQTSSPKKEKQQTVLDNSQIFDENNVLKNEASEESMVTTIINTQKQQSSNESKSQIIHKDNLSIQPLITDSESNDISLNVESSENKRKKLLCNTKSSSKSTNSDNANKRKIQNSESPTPRRKGKDTSLVNKNTKIEKKSDHSNKFLKKEQDKKLPSSKNDKNLKLHPQDEDDIELKERKLNVSVECIQTQSVDQNNDEIKGDILRKSDNGDQEKSSEVKLTMSNKSLKLQENLSQQKFENVITKNEGLSLNDKQELIKSNVNIKAQESCIESQILEISNQEIQTISLEHTELKVKTDTTPEILHHESKKHDSVKFSQEISIVKSNRRITDITEKDQVIEKDIKMDVLNASINNLSKDNADEEDVKGDIQLSVQAQTKPVTSNDVNERDASSEIFTSMPLLPVKPLQNSSKVRFVTNNTTTIAVSTPLIPVTVNAPIITVAMNAPVMLPIAVSAPIILPLAVNTPITLPISANAAVVSPSANTPVAHVSASVTQPAVNSPLVTIDSLKNKNLETDDGKINMLDVKPQKSSMTNTTQLITNESFGKKIESKYIGCVASQNKTVGKHHLATNMIPVQSNNVTLNQQNYIEAKVEVPGHLGNYDSFKFIKDFQTDEKKFTIKEEVNQESNSIKADSFEMSDKISSAVDSLMSLKNVKKLDEKVETLSPTGSSLKKGFEVEIKKFQRQELDFKRMQEIESKRIDSYESKRVKFQDSEIKRVTIQEPDCKRVTIVEPRSHVQEGDVKRFQLQEHKPKPEHSQVLKGCSNPKSMLKPGTLIDIAGISHSPDIMAPLRPGSDGEIIPMGKPVRVDMPEHYKLAIPGVKAYEPRVEQNFYGYRWQTPEKNSAKPEQIMDKDLSDNKSRLPVNENAWRLAFKNVKDPASNNNVPAEKPAVRKQLSVTALAKRHSKSKSEVPGSEKTVSPQPPIPFQRQNKPFLGTNSPVKSKISTETISNLSSTKKNSGEIDLSSLREKEAEVEEFVRQYVTRGLSRSFTPVETPQTFRMFEEHKMSPGESTPRSDGTTTTNSSNPFQPTPQDQVCTNKQLTSQVQPMSKQLPLTHDQSNTSSFLVYDSKKRAGSPSFFRSNRLLPESSVVLTDSSTSVNDPSLSKITTSGLNQNLDQTIQNVDASSTKRFDVHKPLKSTYFGDDQSNKLVNSLQQYNSKPDTFLTSTVVGGQHNDNVFQHIQSGKIRHSSPTISCDNLFKDIDVTKRTKSPTLPNSYPLLSSSPQASSMKRNSSSPVSIKCSKNIFKEVVPATRSYSPTSSSASQSENDSLGNIFSPNPNFKRSISPLCNKPAFLTSSGSVVVKEDPTRMTNISDSKPVGNCLDDDSKIPLKNELQNNDIKEGIVQHNTVPVTSHETDLVPTPNLLISEKSIEVIEDLEQEGNRNKNPISGLIKESNNVQQDVNSSQQLLSVSTCNPGSKESKLSLDGTTEAKHRLPFPVEQTLKKLSNARSSPNKKTLQSQKDRSNEQNKAIENVHIEGSSSHISPEVISDDKIVKTTTISGKLSTGIYSHDQAGELDLGLKKKVNMSNEEIKRWLNESSNESSLIEHRVNCGILENNVCECEYSNTTASSYHIIETPKPEILDNVNLQKSKNLQFEKIDVTHEEKPLSPVEASSNKAIGEKINSIISEKDEIIENQNKAKEILLSVDSSNIDGDYTVAEEQKEYKSIDTTKKTTENDFNKVSLNLSTPCKNPQNSDSQQELPTTPPANKTRVFRLPSKSADCDQELSISEMSSPPMRDDISSSNDVSSSNEETPDKFAHPERRAIFHQRRSALKVKERRELISPSIGAFSPENESSVYAFEPDLPPASTPFRRCKGKDSRSTNTTTDDDDSAPSSNSIAVQVNFEANEAVLECSTQTDVQEGDDDDMHTFYIPLQKSNTDTTKPPLFQGVAVKVDTEGPDQKVIMRAKLVTKPLSTFNRTSSTPSRALIGPRSGTGSSRPEQKVRPLSVKPPVGTVQPTARPKPPTPGPSNTCSPQATRLAKRIKNKVAVPSTSASESVTKVPPAKLVEAPTFYPTEKEFEDPLEYIDSITPEAEKFGLCRVVPPSNFKPECKVSDDMRFTAYNQYIHKMLHRWGPNVKEMLAIKKYLATQSISLNQPPWIGGMEVDLPRLYQTVQQCGGLKEVIEKKRWHRVADTMKIPKSAQDRVTKLDDIYCKFLLPYDTLSHAERTELFEEVEKDWIEREKRVENSQDEDEDSDSGSDIDECITKGRSMALNAFYRIARNTMSMWFPKTETPSAADVELEFWKHVASRQHHVCVHAGSIDSGSVGYGFPTGKNSSTSRHPWNLKMLTNNPGSILRFLGPIMGVTVPTLHVGMLFSACCWYRDPHGLPWIEYLHTGASKIWYGIPDSSSAQFKSAVMSLVPRLCRDKTLWLASDTAMVPPPLLVERGVSLSRIVQDPGQFIIVFPKAFTSSVCTGYLVSESVYFAQPSWIVTAHNLFNDMRESSEPTMFCLEKLLFSIVNDSRSSVEVLTQILPIVVSLRDGEIAGRRQLEELGLTASERLNTNKRRNKSRAAVEDEEDYECDKCRTNLFISFMSNSHDHAAYCLPHAVELLSHKRSQVKHCSLLYSFSEDELEDLVEKLKSRVENKNQKKVQNKSSRS